MFGSKARRLEELVEKRDMELAALTERSAEMEKKLAGYYAKEEAIIGALTEAKTTAARIVSAAEKVRDDMVEDAEQSKKLASDEAERVLAEARAHAERIEREAGERAEEQLLSVETELQMYRETLSAFNAQLILAADDAKAHALKFEALARGEAISDDSVEIQYGTDAMHTRLEREAEELPETYETPSELMRGIYSLQGRDLPPLGGHKNEADEAYEEKAQAPAEAELPSEPVIESGESAEEEKEDHVWTVDEIISDAMAKTEGDITVDAQLNALIDDVLKG